MEAHPIATTFRKMTLDEFSMLKESIKSHGLREPIDLFEGKILDGIHRFKACQELNIKPKFNNFHENGVTAVEHATAKNLPRRHLDKCQAYAHAVLAGIKMKESGKAPRNVNTKKPNVNGTIAREFGLNRSILSDCCTIYKERPDLFKKLLEGTVSIRHARLCCKDKPIALRKNEIKSMKQLKSIVTEDEAQAAIRLMIEDGWFYEMTYDFGGWKCHFYKGQDHWIGFKHQKAFRDLPSAIDWAVREVKAV